MRGIPAFYYLLLATAIAIAACGQILLKLGAMRSAANPGELVDIFTLLGLGAYGLGALCYIVVIKRIPISIAYPSVALSYVVVALAAHFLWHERLGAAQMAGIALIWGGVLMLYAA